MLPERMPDKDIQDIVKHVECAYMDLNKRWPNATIKVFPILPAPGREHNENFKKYNESLRMSAILKSDAYFAWDLDLENDFEDDVHLNESGYKKFVNQITEALNVLNVTTLN